MAHTDPISDMLIRIKNAYLANHIKLMVGYSRLKEDIVRVLKKEGYLEEVKVEGKGKDKIIKITLKYADGVRVFTDLRRISKPGLRKYSGSSSLPKVLSGLGHVVVSTPKGVMTAREAGKANVGGELICEIW